MSAHSENGTSIGDILIQMGALSKEQLREAVEEQERSSMETMLGNLLIAHSYCTREQISIAIAAQKGLLSSHKSDKAMATAEIASYAKKRLNGRQRVVIDRADEITNGTRPAILVPKSSNA